MKKRAAIWFDHNHGNYIMNRYLRFTDESILPPRQRPQQRGTYRAFDRTKEAVAPFRNRLNVARIHDIIVQRLPQLANSYAKTTVKIDKGIFRPDPVPQFLAGDYLSGVFQKHNQKSERLLLQLHTRSISEQLARGCAYLKLAEFIDSIGMCLHI